VRQGIFSFVQELAWRGIITLYFKDDVKLAGESPRKLYHCDIKKDIHDL
jgi:hypothetical protein